MSILATREQKDSWKNGGCLTAIRNHLPNLSAAEKRIGKFILENPELSLNLGIVELAGKCRVSPAMVTRFSTRIGFAGFTAMKTKLRVDILSADDRFHQSIQAGDSETTILEKVLDLAVLGLRDSLTTVDPKELSRAAEAIMGSRFLFFAPAGMSSQGVLQIFKQKLLNLGIVAVDPPEHYLAAVQASSVQRGDVILGISHSGVLGPALEFMEQCQKQGAVTICLTNYNEAPITKVSDIRLVTAASRSSPIHGEAITVRISQLAVLDTLYAIMALAKYRTEPAADQEGGEPSG